VTDPVNPVPLTVTAAPTAPVVGDTDITPAIPCPAANEVIALRTNNESITAANVCFKLIFLLAIKFITLNFYHVCHVYIFRLKYFWVFCFVEWLNGVRKSQIRKDQYTTNNTKLF